MCEFYDKVYNKLSQNQDKIIKEYGTILDPKSNKTTQMFLDNEQNDLNEAYTLSFMVSFLLCMQVADIDINQDLFL